MAYGVKTANIYDLLENSDAENVEPVKPDPKPAPVKEKEAAKTVTPVAAGVEARLRGTANGPPGGRGRGEGRTSRGGRGGRGFDRPARDDVDAGDAEGERRSRPGRGRGARGGERGRRRDADRQDGTGRGHETEKRDGGGKGNWGAIGEEEKVEEVVNEEKAAEPEPPTPEPTPETPAEEEEPTEPEKEEMTLDEYEKLMQEKRASLNSLSKKPSSEAKADPKAFEGMKAYSRPSGTESNELELKTKKAIGTRKSGAAEKTRKEKEVVPTGFRVGSDEFGGRGRGGPRGRGDRGGPRRDDRPEREDRPPRRSDGDSGRGPRGGGFGGGGGFRGRGGDRPFGGRGRGRDGPAPAIDDASAFPTLGGGK